MNGQTAPEWGSIAPPLVFDDIDLEALAETIWEIHKTVVSNAGFDLTQVISEQKRETCIGTILSVLSPVFAPVFGMSPVERYTDTTRIFSTK